MALPGIASYFRASSDDERSHALQFIDYQLLRGGRVRLSPVNAPSPESLLGTAGGGAGAEALEAFELVLQLEKLVTVKLKDLAIAAEGVGDRQLQGFVDNMLTHQAEDINKVVRSRR